jgi:PIN domain nuclease of toxin-antitoxin system
VRLLLDTHIWLWSLLEPERLSPTVAAALVDADTERWLSPLCVWEALLLIERKRLHVDRPAESWVREALERAPVIEAPLNHEVALASRRLKTRHRDPVDRFLLATAQVFDLTLVTQDGALLAQTDVKRLPNRSGRSANRRLTGPGRTRRDTKGSP